MLRKFALLALATASFLLTGAPADTQTADLDRNTVSRVLASQGVYSGGTAEFGEAGRFQFEYVQVTQKGSIVTIQVSGKRVQ